MDMVEISFAALFLLTAVCCLDAFQLKKQDPLFMKELFEGDILGMDRKRLTDTVVHVWKRREIPFQIDHQLSFIEQKAVTKAIKEIEQKTCIKFVKRHTEEDYLLFKRGNGCASFVGKIGGRQDVLIGKECAEVGVVEHLLMHALGFWHEQSRQDRQHYLLINLDNVQQDERDNFLAYTHPKSDHMAESFDYKSIMFMSPYAFAMNKSMATILSKDERYTVGQRLSMSDTDVIKLKRRYCGMSSSSEDVVDDQAESVQSVVEHNRPMDMAKMSKVAAVAAETSVGNECSDESDKCPLWASQGDCYKRPTVMSTRCRRSCTSCQRRSECKNYNSLCGVWAWLGRCTQGAGSTTRRVLNTCPLACGVCVPYEAEAALKNSTSVSTCRNWHHLCVVWANQGRCFYTHTLTLCPLSCAACPSRVVTQPATCRNHWSSKRCARWRNLGWCTRNRSISRRHCRQTCGFCERSAVSEMRVGHCTDRNALCALLSRNHLCRKLSFAVRYCPKSCHVC